MKKLLKKRRCFYLGQSLVEALVALSVFGLLASAIIFLIFDSYKSTAKGGSETRAASLMTESLEACRAIRDRAWNELLLGTFGLSSATGFWQFSGSSDEIDGFTRQVTIEDIYRDNGGQGDIVDPSVPGATLDLNTRRITTDLSWSIFSVVPRQLEVVTYLTNWNSNDWTETAEADFSDGTLNNTQVTNELGGEVRLAEAEGEDIFGNRFLVESTSSIGNMDNSQKWTSLRFTAQATKTVRAVRVYLHSNQGNSPTYRYGLQADNAGRPSGTWLGSTNQGYGDLKSTSSGWQTITFNENVNLTEGNVYHLVVRHISGIIDCDRYISLRKSSPQNQIVPYTQVTDPNSNVLWTVNSGSSWTEQNAQPIYILEYTDGSYEGNPYYQSLEKRIFGNNFRGEVFTIGSDITVSRIGFYVRKRLVRPPEDDLFVTLYDVTDSEQLANEVLVSAGSVSTSYSWYEVDFDSPILLTSGHQYRIYLSSSGTSFRRAYQIYVMRNINQSSDNSINYDGTNSGYLYSTNSGSRWTQVNYQDIAFRFTATTVEYETSGIYESSNFDTGDESNFNYIKWSEEEYSGGDLRLQIRTAATEEGLALAPWSGLEGAGSYFTDPAGALIPISHNGNRWIQYRLEFTSDGGGSPILKEIVINYK